MLVFATGDLDIAPRGLVTAPHGLVLESYVSQSACLPVQQCLSACGHTHVCLCAENCDMMRLHVPTAVTAVDFSKYFMTCMMSGSMSVCDHWVSTGSVVDRVPKPLAKRAPARCGLILLRNDQAI